jgi:hypothetical protein
VEKWEVCWVCGKEGRGVGEGRRKVGGDKINGVFKGSVMNEGVSSKSKGYK